jgi:hypothetical protein
MIAARLDMTVVAEILGHADIKTLAKVYAHALEEKKRGATTHPGCGGDDCTLRRCRGSRPRGRPDAQQRGKISVTPRYSLGSEGEEAAR